MTLFDLPSGGPSPARAAGRPARGAPPAPGRTRVALGLAYDGSAYHGFAPQPGIRTVGGDLANALGRIAGREVEIVGAGRTDAGVHATAQVVHADFETSLLATRHFTTGAAFEELTRLRRSLDAQLGDAASCWRAVVVPGAFHARFAATARFYRYEIDVGGPFDPRRRHFAWRHEGPLDLAVMRLATDPLIGEHDFAAFCRRPPDRPDGPLVRRVLFARWATAPGRLAFEIAANAFCHQMVRAIVGTLVAAGAGRRRASDVVALLHSGSRCGAPPLAPAAGLCLVGVGYPEDLGGWWGDSPAPAG